MNAATIALAERLGIALLHSLWQGAIVGCVLLGMLPALNGAKAQVRYLVCWGALTLMLALPIATFLATPVGRNSADEPQLRQSALAASAATALEAAATLLPAELAGQRMLGVLPIAANEGHKVLVGTTQQETPQHPTVVGRWLSPRAETLLLAIVAAWCGGVLVLSCRVAGGYLMAARLTRQLIEPLDESWQRCARRLIERMAIGVPVELLQSARTDVPVVIGCLRPVILLPIGLVLQLPLAQIEAVLAHELAHVRRYDFLFNAVQCLIETLLFYHPCMWWVSARIRAERECCCDELAIAACGDAATYARALTGLEETRAPSRLALALNGGGSLLSRIRRIAGHRRANDVVGGWLAGILAVAVPLVVGGAWAWGRVTSDTARSDLQVYANASQMAIGDERLFRDALAVTEDLARALSTVRGARSAATAAEELVELSRRQADVDRRLRRLRNTMSVETEEELARRWAQRLADAGKRLKAEVTRVEQIPGAIDALRSSLLFEAIGLRATEETAAGANRDLEAQPRLLAMVKTPFGGPAADPLERMIADYGLEQIATVVVAGVPGDASNFIYEHLRGLAPNLSYFGTSRGDTVTVQLAPVSDLDSLASRIELGQVTKVDREKRLIHVQADGERLPRQLADRRANQASLPAQSFESDSGEDHALRRTGVRNLSAAENASLADSLSKRLLVHDRDAVEGLIALGADAEAAVAQYVQHADRRVRRDALLVLKKIATEASLPAILQALDDADLGNRDLAWQTICHVPQLMQQPRVIEAAAAALKRHHEQAGQWLTSIGPAAEHSVLPYLQHADEEVRFQAAHVLKEIGAGESLAALKRLADDEVELVASAAKAASEAILQRLSR